MTLTQLKKVLYDARFIKVIEILNTQHKVLAIYLIRLVTQRGLAFSKKYIARLDKFKEKIRNPLQY